MEFFRSWVTTTENRLYLGWFGCLMVPTLVSATFAYIIGAPPVDIDGIREPVSGSLLYANNIISGAVIPSSNAMGVHFYPIWEAASLDEWLYNGGTYQVVIFHFFIGVCSYLGHLWHGGRTLFHDVFSGIGAESLDTLEFGAFEKQEFSPSLKRMSIIFGDREVGVVQQIIGSVIDVQVTEGTELPDIYNLLKIKIKTLSDRSALIYRLAEVNLLLSPTLVRCILISGSEGLSRGLKVYDTHPEITKLLSIYSLTRIFNGLIEINLRDPALESCPPLPVPPIWRFAPKITDLGGVSASQIETGIKVIDAGIPIKRGDKTPLSRDMRVQIIRTRKIQLCEYLLPRL